MKGDSQYTIIVNNTLLVVVHQIVDINELNGIVLYRYWSRPPRRRLVNDYDDDDDDYLFDAIDKVTIGYFVNLNKLQFQKTLNTKCRDTAYGIPRQRCIVATKIHVGYVTKKLSIKALIWYSHSDMMKNLFSGETTTDNAIQTFSEILGSDYNLDFSLSC